MWQRFAACVKVGGAFWRNGRRMAVAGKVAVWFHSRSSLWLYAFSQGALEEPSTITSNLLAGLGTSSSQESGEQADRSVGIRSCGLGSLQEPSFKLGQAFPVVSRFLRTRVCLFGAFSSASLSAPYPPCATSLAYRGLFRGVFCAPEGLYHPHHLCNASI
jgi:hypothetical protein